MTPPISAASSHSSLPPIGNPVPLAGVRPLPPLEPPTVWDFVTFEEHVEGVRRRIDRARGAPDAWYDAPTFYFTNPYAVIGPYDDVPVPPGAGMLDFELEVAVVVDPLRPEREIWAP
jgi:2-keto-4-pentenoate hydratase/2-oxohepta-3-ene-1,7-dioic acid hydratase in catechol pathway